MQSTKIILTLWAKWKKPIKLVIKLDLEDVRDNAGNNNIKVETPFNSWMTEFVESRNTDELIQHTFAQIKMLVENPQIPEGGFSIDQMMHLRINRKLELT